MFRLYLLEAPACVSVCVMRLLVKNLQDQDHVTSFPRILQVNAILCYHDNRILSFIFCCHFSPFYRSIFIIDLTHLRVNCQDFFLFQIELLLHEFWLGKLLFPTLAYDVVMLNIRVCSTMHNFVVVVIFVAVVVEFCCLLLLLLLN